MLFKERTQEPSSVTAPRPGRLIFLCMGGRALITNNTHHQIFQNELECNNQAQRSNFDSSLYIQFFNHTRTEGLHFFPRRIQWASRVSRRLTSAQRVNVLSAEHPATPCTPWSTHPKNPGKASLSRSGHTLTSGTPSITSPRDGASFLALLHFEPQWSGLNY